MCAIERYMLALVNSRNTARFSNEVSEVVKSAIDRSIEFIGHGVVSEVLLRSSDPLSSSLGTRTLVTITLRVILLMAAVGNIGSR
jgi:hypothetical protein